MQTSTDPMNLTFVDADSLYFKVCYKTKKKNEIRKWVSNKLDRIERLTSADAMFITVKGRDNYRNLIYPDYKGHRRELEPDMKKALAYAHEYLLDHHEATQADGMEADDVVSIWAHEAKAAGHIPTVAGIDKDLLQIPCRHFNFDKEEMRDIDEDEGHLLLMKQCLTGDSTDNIPGIKGIGPKKAEKILAGVPKDRRWSVVEQQWREAGAGDPLLSYHLLKMLEDWDEREEILASYIPSESSDSESDAGPLEGESTDEE